MKSGAAGAAAARERVVDEDTLLRRRVAPLEAERRRDGVHGHHALGGAVDGDAGPAALPRRGRQRVAPGKRGRQRGVALQGGAAALGDGAVGRDPDGAIGLKEPQPYAAVGVVRTALGLEDETTPLHGGLQTPTPDANATEGEARQGKGGNKSAKTGERVR